MATVIGKTSDRIDQLLANVLVGAEIDSSGNLLITNRQGAVTNLGNVNADTVRHLQKLIEPNATNKGLVISDTLAMYQESSSNIPGYLIIQTNLTHADTMVRLHIEGWDYESAVGNIVDSVITFYPFSDGNIYHADHKNNGTKRFDEVHILKRNSDGKIAIALRPGTTGNYWNYPKLRVSGMFGHILVPDSALAGWTISRSESLTGYTTKKTFDDGPTHMRAVLYQAEPTPSGAWYTLIYWNVTDSDPDIVYSGTSTWTLNKPGTYLFTASAMFRNEVSSAGVRALGVNIAGVGHIMTDYAPPIVGQGDYATARISHVCRVNAGANVSVQTLQNSGGSVNVHQGAYTQLTITRLGSR